MGLQDGQTARAVMNYYQVLEVPPDATPEDIKRAYRQLVRKHHPDVATEETGDRFHQIQAAYEILSDPGERRKYDLSVGWGRSPRTAIPYRPARATKTGSVSQPAPQAPAAQSSTANSPSSASPTSSQSSARAGDRTRSARTGASQRSKFDNTEFTNGGRPPTPQRPSHGQDRRAASNRSATSYQPPPARPRTESSSHNHSGDRSARQGATRAKSAGERSGENGTSNYTNRMRSAGADRSSSNGNGAKARGSTANVSTGRGSIDSSSTGGDYRNGTSSPTNANTASTNSGTSKSNDRRQPAAANSSSYKPYSPPPRPEPKIPSFNRGVKSLKEALRSNRYSLATEIADVLAAHYSDRPQTMRLFVKAYHLRGNEMLYYKRYELAEIYLYEALKTAYSHYPELVETIQSDLERTDTNRRELGMT